MFPDTDDAAIQADAYIDALLTVHRRLPVAVTEHPSVRAAGVRDAIRLLEKGLPRFHPSFLFEEWLADQLKRAADKSEPNDGQLASATIIPIAIIPSPGSERSAGRRADRRFLVGGAIASGVSIAGAAMFAWRRGRRRGWES